MKKAKYKTKYTRDFVQELVDKHESIAQILDDLGLKKVGGNYTTIKKWIRYYDIDTSHFTGQSWAKSSNVNSDSRVRRLRDFIRIPNEDVFCENSSYDNGTRIKKRLFEDYNWEYKCYECGISEWNGKAITLHLDHINGIHSDNRFDNLTLLCPNCHSQTQTYAGKNINSGVRSMRDKHESGKLCFCGAPLHYRNKTGKCVTCYRDSLKKENKISKDWRDKDKLDKRKFNVSKDELATLIKKHSFCAIGRMYGVSDNAIRKRAKRLGILT